MASAPRGSGLTVGEAIERYGSSRSTAFILKRCHPPGPSRQVNTTAFLYFASISKELFSNTAASVVYEAMAGTPGYSGLEKAFHVTFSKEGLNAPVSEGLRQAFEFAVALRRRVSDGSSDFNLRHLVFAMFSAAEDPLRGEMDYLFRQLGSDRMAALDLIGRYVLDRLKDDETWGAWVKEFEMAGLKAVPRTTPDQKTAQPAAAPRPRGVPLVNADDPWAQGLIDRMGARAEARAFAAMITARSFTPPLAVGVFGNWGSGKSFFMRLLHEEVEAHADPDGVKSAAAGVDFCGNVVQIRFNAWHYVETNLWASLVDHIFTSLDQQPERAVADATFERLSTARELTVESAEALVQRRVELREAARKQTEADEALERARREAQQSPDAIPNMAWKQLAKKSGAELKTVASRLGLPALETEVRTFLETGATLKDQAGQSTLLRNATLRFGSSWLLFLVLLGILAGPFALAWVAKLVEGAGLSLSPLAADISGVVAPIVAGLAWARRQAQGAVERLANLQVAFDEQVVEVTKAHAASAEAAKQEFARVEATAAETAERFRIANEKLVEASREYDAQSGRARIMSFVRDRVSKGQYARHLGFVATVRRDFEELSLLMAKGKEAPEYVARAREAHQKRVERLVKEAGSDLTAEEQIKLRETCAETRPEERTLDRIILYIDDLDRCSSKDVVSVLQAIHLLLTFPLFVVFVAVDVRWLRSALASHYAGQLEAAKGEGQLASPGDYLEKIFQIPYWVRSMGGAVARNILEDHLRRSARAVVRHQPDATGDKLGAGEGGARNSQASTAENRARSAPSGESRRQDPPEAGMENLSLTAPESDFLLRASECLDDSPRRALRFVNTYRIIKGSLLGDEAQKLEESGYQALVTLLVIAIGADSVFPALLSALSSDRTGGLSGLIENLDASQGDAGDVHRARVAMERLGKQSSYEALRRYARLVGRFGFQEITFERGRRDLPLVNPPA